MDSSGRHAIYSFPIDHVLTRKGNGIVLVTSNSLRFYFIFNVLEYLIKDACLPIPGKKIYFVNWTFFSKCLSIYAWSVIVMGWKCKNSDLTLFISARSQKTNLLFTYSHFNFGTVFPPIFRQRRTLFIADSYQTVRLYLTQQLLSYKWYTVFTFLQILKYKNPHANLCL